MREIRRTTRVFVYGSLLAGEPNHSVLRHAKRIAKSCTAPTFALHDLGAFPGMVDGGVHAVVGEVYEVDDSTLAALDRLEGHPRFYRRAQITLADGESAETYLLRPAQVKGCPLVESGSWRGHRRERAG
jgi:gamma-glutamylaminecyclotransferase